MMNQIFFRSTWWFVLLTEIRHPEKLLNKTLSKDFLLEADEKLKNQNPYRKFQQHKNCETFNGLSTYA